MSFDEDVSLVGNSSFKLKRYLEEIDKQLDGKVPNGVNDKHGFEGLVYAVCAAMAYSFIGPLLKLIFRRNPDTSAYEVLYW